ncbi:hypothetical protein GCM10027515_31890 [Schumannella luteola]|uniref:Uncharacterized protein n=1 Tax=Schumannella luteola TaxID=472059 RepID=A0A852YCF2_9MICO|nr:hypothetical protein [Schumannella luteola]NYG99010.1 hypothetical protein [Schumannella luteola]TPX06370.1 hypothetical protein FJ656_01685 [Schumannella luteola]
MGKRKGAEVVDPRIRVEQAVRAVMMRREGADYADIATELRISEAEAAEITRVGYGRLAAQTADELRIEVEDRLNGLLRRAHLDLRFADSQSARTALYRTILAIEGRRAQLLGLDLPKAGTGDE